MTNQSDTQRKEIPQDTDDFIKQYQKQWEERRNSKEMLAEALIEAVTADFNWLYQCTGEYHGNYKEL